MTSKKIKNLTAGFSIIEVPITLLIIAVVLVIYNAASNSVLLNKDAKYQDLANHIAVSEIEDLRNLGYGSLPASGSFSHSLLSQLPQNTATLTVVDYNADTKQVTVTVTWKSETSQTHQVTLTTLINEFGL